MCLVIQAPQAEALACDASGHILAVSSSADLLAIADPHTKLVDLQGSFVTPVCIHVCFMPMVINTLPSPTRLLLDDSNCANTLLCPVHSNTELVLHPISNMRGGHCVVL